jgi:hypothetical protein
MGRDKARRQSSPFPTASSAQEAIGLSACWAMHWRARSSGARPWHGSVFRGRRGPENRMAQGRPRSRGAALRGGRPAHATSARQSRFR